MRRAPDGSGIALGAAIGAATGVVFGSMYQLIQNPRTATSGPRTHEG